MKICPVGAKLFHADRRTDSQPDVTKLIVAFTIMRTRLKRLNTAMPERREFTQTHTFQLNSVPQLRNDLDYSASDRTKRKL